MEVFDKGYLKEMSLCVSVNTANPNDVYEKYKFTFGPTGNSCRPFVDKCWATSTFRDKDKLFVYLGKTFQGLVNSESKVML